jgi:oxygen-independent coproporphyrinogen-3 oxidase
VSIGIYIHIPFCRRKCSYCHFISLPLRAETANRYRKSLRDEIDSFSCRLATEEVNSIYLGGGTPSLMPAEYIAAILRACHRRFRITEDCEISLEANPGTMSADKALHLIEAGVNRISLGAQSFVDAELSAIGRLHNSDMISRSVKQLQKAGFVNINLDLLLGLPNQTAMGWRHTLQSAAGLPVTHVSVYMLDLDEPCALSAQAADGLVDLPEDDLVSDLYLETIGFLSASGLKQYEISNFARSGYACRHNLKYWMRKPVYGFGLGSHSFDGESRYANKEQMEDYLSAMEQGGSPVAWKEPVTASRELAEELFLGLRLTGGVDWNELKSRCGDNDLAKYKAALREPSEKGLIEWDNSIMRLTATGMLLSNEIFQMFV